MRSTLPVPLRACWVITLALGIAWSAPVLTAAAEPDVDGFDVTAREEADERLPGPSSSTAIVVSTDDRFVWCCNPDNNSVTQFEITSSGLTKLREILVGGEPRNIAISPDGRFVYVSNTGSGTVSVIRARRSDPRVVDTIRVGTEPYGMAFTPNGSKLYVACARSNNVFVINPDDNDVDEIIDDVGLEPRGVAITNDGDARDTDETVYVTQFFGVDRPGVLIGQDDSKEGRVSVIPVKKDRVTDEVVLNPIADTGFKSNGSAIHRVPPTTPPSFTFVTGAFPNQLHAIAIKGDRAYVPNTGASPDGPVRFNVNVQGLLSVIDVERNKEGEAGGSLQTINLNRGVNFELPGPTKVFFPVPWAIAFEHEHDRGWVVSLSSNVIVRVDLDENGTPTTRAPQVPGDTGAIVRVFVGQSPIGIAIDSEDGRAYVLNEVSRDVSVVDLETASVIATVRAADLPSPGSEAARLLIGKALFNSSTGVNLPELGPSGVTETRLSNEGWSSCVACHPSGLTDGVTWIFGSGPRRSLPLNGSFNPRDPNDAKVLNHSAIFDELQDFELNIRNVSGGLGLITLADGTTPDPTVAAFNPANAGRSERLDLMTEWVAKGIRTPISPLNEDDDSHSAEKGRKLFKRGNCAACHGGPGWSSSRRDFLPPPDATQISNGQLVSFLKQVGTFDPNARNEIRANGAPALGADGFNPPSLLGAHGLGPYLHNGSAQTLLEVLETVPHRASGTGGVDKLGKRSDRERLAEFLASIDARTEPFERAQLQSAEEALADLAAEEALEASASGLVLRTIDAMPLRGQTRVAFDLPREADVRLDVYDILGRRVSTLARGPHAAGPHELAWDGRDGEMQRVAAGVYFIRLETAYGLRTRKVVLVN